MSDQRMAYAVVSGEYSDYRVHALFATKEFAEAAIEDHFDQFMYEHDAWEFEKDYYKGDKEAWAAEHRKEFSVEDFPWYDDATPLGKEVQR